jgi:Fe/S biogenesis protein NfuA
MSTESEDTQSPEDELRERITNFLRRNFPQIQMHGGSAAIQHLDMDEGIVDIQLGGACSGCGISPMTIQAIKTRMTEEIGEVQEVRANTGMGGSEDQSSASSPSFPGETRGGDAGGDEGPEAPF